ncbi:aminotransferase class IV [Streptomyces sp. NPDC006476]|uniref:aminotransferase class IV n=1 Tax=Streptomyces sp. NPDC006476 TaxID=3157175 RepID=UPI0033A8033C
MSLPDDVVFHDEKFVPSADATVRVDSLALRYALSVFEGVRLYRTDAGTVRPWLLEEHLERLAHSLTLMHVPVPDLSGLPVIIAKLVEINSLSDDCYCRIVINAGNVGLLASPVEPLLSVTVRPMGRKKWLAQGRAMRLAVSTRQRAVAEAFPTDVKSICQYAGARLALLDAQAAGFDSCLLSTSDGFVSEAPTATLFAVHSGTLTTPLLADGPLPGITRAWVIAACMRLGIPVRVGRLAPSDLYRADEAFLCGTGLEFAAIGSIDAASFPDAGDTHVFQRLVGQYFAEARNRSTPTALGRWHRD